MSRFLDLEEQEQVAQIKNFWLDNGKYFIAIFLVLAFSYSGWKFYQKYQYDQANAASMIFDDLTVAANQNNLDKVKLLNDKLKTDYASTIYAQESALLTAKFYFEKDQSTQATQELQWVENKAFNSAYRSMARLRLAGIAYDAGEYDQALKWLNSQISNSYIVLVDDLRGDIYKAQNKTQQAIESYTNAYKATNDSMKAILQLKLNKLGVNLDKLTDK